MCCRWSSWYPVGCWWWWRYLVGALVPRGLAITRQQLGDHIIHPINHTTQLQEDLITSHIQLQGGLITRPINHTIQLPGDLITHLIPLLPGDHITNRIQLHGGLITHNHSIQQRQGDPISRIRIHRPVTSKDCCTSKHKLTPCLRRRTSWRFISVSRCKICFTYQGLSTLTTELPKTATKCCRSYIVAENGNCVHEKTVPLDNVR